MASKALPETISAQDLWTFSIHFYQLDNNQALLLSLQDSAAVNVNLVIFVFYLLNKNVQVTAGAIHTFTTEIQELDSLTSRFREKRRHQKHYSDSTGQCKEQQQYMKMLEQELEYEKQQQALLIDVYHNLIATSAQTDSLSTQAAASQHRSYLLVETAMAALAEHYKLQQLEQTKALTELSESFFKMSSKNKL